MTPPRQVIPPDAGKPRMVIDYGGMQIFDAREKVRVVIGNNPPRGLKACLRLEGFSLRHDGTWERANNPHSIFTAQCIGREFFQTEKDS